MTLVGFCENHVRPIAFVDAVGGGVQRLENLRLPPFHYEPH